MSNYIHNELIYDYKIEKIYPKKYENHTELFSSIPSYVFDELKKQKQLINDLIEEVNELKKEIEFLKTIKEEC